MKKLETVISNFFYVSDIYLRSFTKLLIHWDYLKLLFHKKLIPKTKILTYSLRYFNMLRIHNQRDKLYNFFLHLLFLDVFKYLIMFTGNWSLYSIW